MRKDQIEKRDENGEKRKNIEGKQRASTQASTTLTAAMEGKK